MKSKVRRSETKNENPKLTNSNDIPSNPGPIRDTSSSTNIAEDDIRDDKVDFIAQCHYKEIRYNFSSYEYFQIRIEETKRRSCSRLGSDLSSPTVVSSCCATTYSSTTPYSSASPHASVTPHSAHARNHQNDAEWVKHCEELFCECRVQFQSDGIQPQETLMLSAAERQELAENAMEQLASGLNKAAEAMQSEDEALKEEAKPDLANLQDKELFQLLEEAYSYKSKKDRQGKSEIFRELLEKAEENSSGEEQWDINFRKHLVQDSYTNKKKKKRVSESSKKGGSLSNLSLLSDSEYSGSGRAGKKKGRSSVSSRSREGGSLPPTKFENAVLCDFGQTVAPPSQFAWDSGGKIMPGEVVEGVASPVMEVSHKVEQIQQRQSAELFHLPDRHCDTVLDMEGQEDECDTDSNKTEVEEIEMVEMEGRDDETTPLLQARHRMETRGRVIGHNGPDEGIELQSSWNSVRSVTNHDSREREEEEKSRLDENGNPTGYINGSGGAGPFPIMDPQLRPLSIYRHTPIFHPQRLTVPSAQPELAQPEKEIKAEGKRKARRKKDAEKDTIKAEDIEGYRGNKDIDSILQFIDGPNSDLSGKKHKKSSVNNTLEKQEKEKNKKNSKKDSKDDLHSNKEENNKENNKEKRKKKEKSADKETVTKKLSVDIGDSVKPGDNVKDGGSPQIGTRDVSLPPPSLHMSGMVVSAVSSRVSMGVLPPSGRGSVGGAPSAASSGPAPSADSGHVTGGPRSVPSVSSAKELSISSSPPLDLDPGDFVSEESLQETTETTAEFTKVTKKQRKKKGRERGNRFPPGSVFSEENRSRGGEDEVGVSQAPPGGGRGRGHGSTPGGEEGEWSFRGYTRMRGSREVVTGTKSTCSVPPSDASDTDDHDSVHSLPVSSTLAKVNTPAHSVSSGHTPQASYADIARLAAALHTQQAGQQQHAHYRQQLQSQCRESTPGNTKLSISSTEGDSVGYSNFYHDLDTFPQASNQEDHNYPPPESHTHFQPENPVRPSPENHVNKQPDDHNPTESHAQCLPDNYSSPEDHVPTLPVLSTDNNTTNSVSETESISNASQTNSVTQGPKKVDHNLVNYCCGSPELARPPVVILQSSGAQSSPDEAEGEFTFGFEVNESLLAMSTGEINRSEITKKVSNEEDAAEIVSFGATESPVFLAHGVLEGCINNQNLRQHQSPSEDNEMMKNLLSLSDNSQEINEDIGNINDDLPPIEENYDVTDDYESDVVVESFVEDNAATFENTNDLKEVINVTDGDTLEEVYVKKEVTDFSTLYEELEADYGTFNYDVIVNFVQDAWDVVKMELKTGAHSSSVLYYSS